MLMCCYRDRTVSAISYEHFGLLYGFFFLSVMRTFNASILFWSLFFYFSNASFCVNINKIKKKKTQTLVWVWERAKYDQVKRAKSFCCSDMDLWRNDIMMLKKKKKMWTVNWIPEYLYWNISGRRPNSRQLKAYCWWTLLFAIYCTTRNAQEAQNTHDFRINVRFCFVLFIYLYFFNYFLGFFLSSFVFSFFFYLCFYLCTIFLWCLLWFLLWQFFNDLKVKIYYEKNKKIVLKNRTNK